MYNLFKPKAEIQQAEFIKKWEDSESEREKAGTPDQFARDWLEKHKNSRGLRYYIGSLAEDGLSNLILPYHNHVSNEVRMGGEPFWEVVVRYSKRIQAGESDDCLQRLSWIEREIIGDRGGMVEVKFTFVSDDRELAMPPGDAYRDHGDNKLYAGNFHQFVAYGLWIKENGYHPIETHLCTRSPMLIDIDRSDH